MFGSSRAEVKLGLEENLLFMPPQAVPPVFVGGRIQVA